MFGDRFCFDLVVVGFPCQDLSSAFKAGAGLAGARSSLFFDFWVVVCKLGRVNPGLYFVLECVYFEKKPPVDFKLVGEVIAAEPVVLCASTISACFRKRAFWASFDILPLGESTVWPSERLAGGRVSVGYLMWWLVECTHGIRLRWCLMKALASSFEGSHCVPSRWSERWT